MVEKPTRAPIQNEARNGLRNLRGTVAMARTQDANSATAQFFISVRDNHMLDYGMSGAGYAVFGRVVAGMDVVDKIVMLPTTSRGPYQNVPELSVVIKRAQEKAPVPAATRSDAPAAAKP
jgi:peptidyl-prolyl cis-trans isomerase A (cyclophilin A)